MELFPSGLYGSRRIDGQLRQDADEILQGADANTLTTILCVALRQKDSRIKKFVFTNQSWLYETSGAMQKICQEAHKRGYHVIVAQQSHAEGQFLQFLQERPTNYTHLVGMGSNRSSCLICDPMLSKIIPNYSKISDNEGTNRNDRSRNWYYPLALKAALKAHGHTPDTTNVNPYNDSWGDEKKHQPKEEQYRRAKEWIEEEKARQLSAIQHTTHNNLQETETYHPTDSQEDSINKRKESPETDTSETNQDIQQTKKHKSDKDEKST